MSEETKTKVRRFTQSAEARIAEAKARNNLRAERDEFKHMVAVEQDNSAQLRAKIATLEAEDEGDDSPVTIMVNEFNKRDEQIKTLEAERDEATLKAVEECDAKHLAWNKSEALEAEVQKLREALKADLHDLGEMAVCVSEMDSINRDDVKVLERLAFLIQGRENGIRAALNSNAGEKEKA